MHTGHDCKLRFNVDIERHSGAPDIHAEQVDGVTNDVSEDHAARVVVDDLHGRLLRILTVSNALCE